MKLLLLSVTHAFKFQTDNGVLTCVTETTQTLINHFIPAAIAILKFFIQVTALGKELIRTNLGNL
jgi:hypothetical protein